MVRNQAREEFFTAFRTNLGQAMLHDKRSVVIGLIKVVNAFWFAGLAAAGFALTLPLVLWIFFLPLSLAFAVYLEQGREQGEPEKPV